MMGSFLKKQLKGQLTEPSLSRSVTDIPIPSSPPSVDRFLETNHACMVTDSIDY